jgi:glycosyltransferase involved in cell wall biosynthesis
VLVYSFSRRFGHQIALTAGCGVADGDAVILMDSDLQHPPEVIPQMVKRWHDGFDIVSAIRLSTDEATLFKRWSAAAFYKLINLFSDTSIVAGAADFVLLSRRAHQALLQMPERHRFLRGMVSWIGFRRGFVNFRAPARTTGVSSYSPRRMLHLAADAIFSFSSAPIRAASRVGLFVSAGGLVYLLYILYSAFFHHADLQRGWGSLISVVLIIGGLQLVFIGLIGEYIARIFEEVKGRPLYFFKQQPQPHARLKESESSNGTRSS